ncbi:uncharacterized protein LOC144916486 [Branchiostoma floridae x Branchiostoma belcheri]
MVSPNRTGFSMGRSRLTTFCLIVLCSASAVEAIGSDGDFAADLTEPTGEGVYGEDSVEFSSLDFEKDVTGEDVLAVDSYTDDATHMADNKEQEALRVLQAPTTSDDEKLGIDAVDFAEKSINQDADAEYALALRNLRPNSNGWKVSSLNGPANPIIADHAPRPDNAPNRAPSWVYKRPPIALFRPPPNAPTEAPNCDRWTGWFDRDNPSGIGDYETLLHLRRENPGKICSTPSAIQARVRGSQVPASQTGEHFDFYDTDIGLACRNSHQSDRYCQDYEVRFCCSQSPNPGTTKAPANPTITTQGPTNAPTEPPNCDRWTGWFDRDNPSGNGDFETLLHLRRENPGKICSTPSAIQARVRGSQVPASQTGEHFDYYDTDVGFACTNYRQSDRYCQDYEVRFCCSQNPNSGTTNAPANPTIATQGPAPTEPPSVSQKIIFPGPRGIDDYARMETTLSEDLTSFTLCVHMRSNMDSSNAISLVSYAVSQHNNELLLYFWDGEWHAVCTTWRSSDGAWQLYADGVLTASGSGFKVGGRVRTGGTWILGQHQDVVGGGFNAYQSFIGELSEVNLWDRVLSPAEIAADCSYHGNVIDWDTTNTRVFGDASRAEYPCAGFDLPPAHCFRDLSPPHSPEGGCFQ